MASLSSSAEQEGLEIEWRSFVDPTLDPGVPGGAALIALGRAAANDPGPEAMAKAAEEIGEAAATRACEIAGAFAMTNRIIEGTGAPTLQGQVERLRPVIEVLGADRFPHSALVTRKPRTRMQKLARRLRG